MEWKCGARSARREAAWAVAMQGKRSWRSGRRALVAAAAGLGALAVLAMAVLLFALPLPERAPYLARPSILIEDRYGRTLYEAIDPEGSKRVPLPLPQIPLACRQAILATEDSNFYHHRGVDLLALGRALWQNLSSGRTVSGASTLTQQLARNLYMPPEERLQRTPLRKLKEAWLALQLELRYDKDELLALYLNTTDFGHFASGIEGAARAYFGQGAQGLDLAQCALLAGLPQSPAAYNPTQHPDAARRRQRVVLALMVRDGAVSEAEAAAAAAEQLSFAVTPFPISAPHFVIWAQEQTEQLLGAERTRAGGLRVRTTLDLDWQEEAERAVRRQLAALQPCLNGTATLCDPDAESGRRVEGAALVALDPHGGAVRAMVGSPDYFDSLHAGALNAAFALRQPGSAIKPLTYAAAFGMPDRPWTPATLIPDVRTAFVTDEGRPYIPQNYDLRYHGPVTARAALANSYNVPAVRTLEYVGIEELVRLAGRLGIDSFETPPDVPQAGSELSSRFGLALTLGGGEVRLIDLTAAYGAFANGGYRVEPFAIERIETLEGDLLYTRAAPEPGPAVLDPRVAYLISDILSDDEARRPGFGAGSPLEIGRPAAVKTGTTTDWRDNWTVGYTPDLVAGVWVGNPDNSPMEDVSGVSGAAPIWHDFMRGATRDLPGSSPEFGRPDGLVRVEVCADSGLLPGDARPGAPLATIEGLVVFSCPHRRYELFIAGTEPTTVDRSHVRLRETDPRSGRVDWRETWLLPPEYTEWARAEGVWQPASGSPTGAIASSSQPSQAADLLLVSPEPNRRYRLDPATPRTAQRVPVTVRPGSTVLAEGGVKIVIDGVHEAGATAPEYTYWWQLEPGRHTFEAVAQARSGGEISSPSIEVFVE